MGLVACLPCACAPPSPKPPAPAPPEPPAPAESRAWFRYAGDERHEISQAIRIEGGCLAVTSTGLRAVSPRGDCVGPWEIAPQRLPPVAAVRKIDRGFAFLTERGTAWISTYPTSAVTSSVRPPPGLVPAGGAFVGVDQAGRPYHFDGDWKASALPEGVALFTLQAAPQGVFALGAPESIWVSADQGARFVRAATDPADVSLALTALRWTQSGALFADGRAGDLTLAPTTGTFRKVATDTHEEARDPDMLTVPPAPAARALEGRTAALAGTRYLEIRGSNEGARHHLVRGTLGEALEEIPLPALSECHSVWMAARESAEGGARTSGGDGKGGPSLPKGRGVHLVVACEHAGEVPETTLFFSADGGDTFTEQGRYAMESASAVRLAVTADGAALTSGVCPLPSPGSTGRAECRAGSLALWRADGGRTRIAAGPMDRVLGLAAEPRGTVFVVGLHEGLLKVAWGPVGDRETSLRQVSLAALNVALSEDGGDVHLCSTPETDERGALGFCVAGGREETSPKRWIVVGRDGALASQVAIDAAAVAGAGERVMAVGEAVRLSRDGGATWETIAISGETARGVACSDEACVIGDGLVHLDRGATELLSPAQVTEENTDRIPKLGPAITCRPADGAAPVELDRVITWYLPLPQLDDLALGDALWSLTTEHPRTGVVERVVAAIDPKTPGAPLLRRALLGARPAPPLRAVEMFGAIARARSTAPDPLPTGGASPTPVDVAWTDVDTGRSATAVVGGAWKRSHGERPPYLSVDVQVIDGWLVTPAGATAIDGAKRFLRIEAVGAPFSRPMTPSSYDHIPAGAGTLAQVVLSPIREHWPRTFAADISAVTYAWVDHGQSPPVTRARTIAARADATFSRRGAEKGVIVMPFSETETEAPRTGVFHPILATGELGPGVPVAAPSDFDRAPRRCTRGERAGTPRAVWKHSEAAFADGRRVVALAQGSGLDWGLSDGVVLHGSPGQPCASALRASALRGAWTVVLDGSLAHGWLFRPGPPAPGDRQKRRSTVTLLPLVCEAAPGLRAPPEVEERAREESGLTRLRAPGWK